MSTEQSLVAMINQRLAGDLRDLPVFHSVAVRLHQMFVKRDFRIEDIINLIAEDQALTSQVLKLANSSFYSGLSKIATIKDAVVRLGAQEIANLAMLASQSEGYRSKIPALNAILQRLWEHALACATGSRWLAKAAGFAPLAAEAFMAGLLHDIGKLAIVKALDELLQSPSTGAAFSETLIIELLGTMHVEVGERLMTSWSLPDAYHATAARHHAKAFDTGETLLILVRLANLACHKTGKALIPTPEITLFTTPEAHALGIKEITLAELEIVIEDAGELET